MVREHMVDDVSTVHMLFGSITRNMSEDHRRAAAPRNKRRRSACAARKERRHQRNSEHVRKKEHVPDVRICCNTSHDESQHAKAIAKRVIYEYKKTKLYIKFNTIFAI